MKVPEYVSRDMCNMTYCSATIDEKSNVVCGDEYFYNFVGEILGIGFAEHIHEDYKSEFFEVLEAAKKGTYGSCIVAFKDGKDRYRLLDIIFLSKEDKKGSLTYSLKMYNLLNMENKFLNLANDVNKYRNILSMYEDLYFDYDTVADCFTIFMYRSQKSTVITKSTIREFYDNMSKFYDNDEDMKGFELAYEAIIDKTRNFQYEVKAPDAFDRSTMINYQVEGRIIYRYDKKEMVVGKITCVREQEAKKELIYNSIQGKDSMTGLLNKQGFYEYVQDSIKLNEDNHYFIIIDIDNFKEVNDNFGHLFGDEVISRVGAIINSSLSGRGIAGRFGGDEFVIFTNWINSKDKLRSLLTAMRQMIKNAFDEMDITLSIGVSNYPGDAKDYEELFKIADMCLYIAKNKGKNRFIIYDIDKHGPLIEDTNNRRILLAAVDKNEAFSDIVSDLWSISENMDEMKLMNVQQKIIEKFNLDGMRVYRKGMNEPDEIMGNYRVVPDICGYINSGEYDKMFKGKEEMRFGNYEHLKAEFREYYELHSKTDVVATVAFAFETHTYGKVYFLYDIFNHSGRWADTDVNYLMTISKLLFKIKYEDKE